MLKKPESKQLLRTEIAARRNALDVQWLEIASARIAENFQTLEAFRPSGMVALYKAIAGEVDLDTLFSRCWERGKRTCIPVFNLSTKIYEMAEVTAETAYSTGHHRIQEPISPALVPMESIELMAVPGVAFDRNGNRLGRGGGYYDRLLAGFSGLSAGVSFDFQLFPQIPSEPHDIPVDTIVTEFGIINVLNER
jgi:5-formyltetrahydrofolate cyclo-ligase